MKGFIYFSLFFALAINWYLLAVMPDKAEDLKEEAAVQAPIVFDESVNFDNELERVYDSFKDEIKQKNWVDAFEIYQLNYDKFLNLDGISNENHPLKAYLLDTMFVMTAQKDFSDLDALINYSLVLYPQDVNFILMQISALIQKSKITQAIDLYFIKIKMFADNPKKEVLVKEFNSWLDKQYNIWQSNQSYNTIEIIWKKLTHYDSSNVKWQLQLAKILVEQKKYKQAKVIIEIIQFDWDYQEEIVELIYKIDSSFDDSNIDLLRVGNQFQVNASFKDNKFNPDVATVPLLIDTGASYTVIDQEVFNDLFDYVDVEYVGVVNANTANGQVEAKMYEVYEMSLGGFTVKSVKILILDLPEEGDKIQGLLGMNFLQHFKFEIDQSNEVLILK